MPLRGGWLTFPEGASFMATVDTDERNGGSGMNAMRFGGAVVLVAAFGATMLTAGCAQDPEMTDEDYIYQLLWESSLAGMTPLDGQEDGSLRDTLPPQSWFRVQTGYGGFSIELENDPSSGVCTVSVEHGLIGILYIDVVWDDTLIYGEKPVDVMRTRRAIVEREEGSSQYGGWVLTHLTPADYLLAGDVPQEVEIESMRLYLEGELVLECTSADVFIDVRTELPEISVGDLLRFEATASHSNPVYDPDFFLFVHGPCPVWSRHILYDDGSFGDEVAGDGVYTYEWYAEDTIDGQWGIAADVIDTDTFVDQTEDDYDSHAWGMPILEI